MGSRSSTSGTDRGRLGPRDRPRDARAVRRRDSRAAGPRDAARRPRRPRLDGNAAALAGIAVVALALRLLGVGSGLPDFVDESLPLRHALQMWEGHGGAIDWNPHRFHYPSLTFTLHVLLQQALFLAGSAAGAFSSRADFIIAFFADPTASVIAGRLLHVAFDVVTVVALGIAGQRLVPGAGLWAAALYACAPSAVLTTRALTTDTVMTAFGIVAFERMLAWHAAGERTRLLAAAVCVGLAAGSKYPGAALLAPLAWLAWRRDGPRGARSWALAAAVAAATFLATTPWAVLDAATFRRDVAFVGRMTSAGHFGNFDRAGFAYHAANLARDLGPLGVVAMLGAAIVAFRRRERAAGIVAAAIGLLVFGAPIAAAHVEAERYVLPVLAFGALLAGVSLASLRDALPARFRAAAWAVAAAAAVVGPVLAAGAAAAWRTGSTQLEARAWCERSLPPEALMVRELYGPSVLARADQLRILGSPAFRAARRDVQERYRRRRAVPVIDLPIATVGRLLNAVRLPDGTVAREPVMEQGADFNRVFYDPRLLAGADYVATSSAVRGRFAAAPERYPVERAFYALLDSTAEVAARFDPHGRVDGPNIIVYRLGPRARAAIAARGPLDPLWWAESIPPAYRRRAQGLLGASPSLADSTRGPSGEPAPWVTSLAPLFRERIAPFAVVGTIEHDERGNWEASSRFARSLLEVLPDELGAAMSLARAARERDAWAEALPLLERAVTAMGAERAPPALRLEVAEALWRTGQTTRAEAVLEDVARRGGAPAAAAVADLRRRLSTPLDAR